MNAEIIAMELNYLWVKFENTNSVFSSRIGEKVDSTYYQQVVAIMKKEWLKIELAVSMILIILSGGLGPTTDDITSALALLEVPLVEDKKSSSKK